MDAIIIKTVLDLTEKPPGAVENGTLLKKDYMENQWANRASNWALKSILPDHYRKIDSGWYLKEKMAAAVQDAAVQVVRILERQFILDPNTSSLDLLPGDSGKAYRDFKWGRQDFPGNEGCLIYPKKGERCPEYGKGVNHDIAREMSGALTKVLPERKPNKGDTEVVNKTEYDRHKIKIQAAWKNVPVFKMKDIGGQVQSQKKYRKLNRSALQAFIKMRDAAATDAVPLIIGAAHRYPSNKKSDNTEAKANYSNHLLGLAMDLHLSMTTFDQSGRKVEKKYAEITTRPMSNVIKMRESPVHKWMFLNGHKFGWYPYNNEPWHWEYNPPGFREVFRKDTKID